VKAPRSRTHGFARSPCPIANALDVVGDKWSLLVIRDMRRGKQTYTDLLAHRSAFPPTFSPIGCSVWSAPG
jgi:DNA-binding HxlR family transcriptional regulator